MAGAEANEFAHTLLRARDWQDRPEFDWLCEWWQNVGGGVCALVGIGGAGKTAIVDHFLQVLPGGYPDLGEPSKDTDLPATVEPFIFSFYDVPNEDSFFVRLGEWLADVAPDCRPAAVKADADIARVSVGHLSHWLQHMASSRKRTLLVLDGLEKVQDDGRRSGRFGHIPDGRLRNLLLGVADGRLGRLAVLITTRFDLYDPLAERVPYYARFLVEQLGPAACVDLLRIRGVVEPDDSILRRLAEDHGRHALTVDLIGGYIGEFCGGKVARLKPLSAIDLSDLDPMLNPWATALIKQERRFARVAERYRESLAENEPATLALLERLCLFRLGIDADTLASIFLRKNRFDRSKNSISGPALARLTRKQLQKTLDRLVAMKLVEKTEAKQPKDAQSPSSSALQPSASSLQPLSYSIHPAIRDGFLSGLDTNTARQGHEAAREGLTAALGDRPGDNPSDPATLDLLEEIVHHTLQSGHAQEAFDIHWDRIGGFSNLGHRLGAYERGERICRAFAGGASPESLRSLGPAGEEGRGAAAAQEHASAPYLQLSENDQTVFINEWALYLKNLGRLEAAARCYEFQIGMRMRQEEWQNASRGNQNLCNVLLLSGRLTGSGERATGALATAAEALRLAELADEAWERKDSLEYRAVAQARLGQVPAALADFRKALEWQHKAEGDDDPVLYSTGGTDHTQLLARLGRREEARQLTEANVEILLEVAGPRNYHEPHCHLILSTLHVESGDLSSAERLWASARDWALARDAKEVLCWAALVEGTRKAECGTRSEGDLAGAGSAIEDGLKIARDCGFGLYHIDLLLARARLHLLRGAPSAALDDLRIALDDGIPGNDATGQPELLAANADACGYAWPIPAGLQLRAEAQLLQAAQQLGSDSFVPAKESELPAEVRNLIVAARNDLTTAMDLWQPLHDPEPERPDQNFQLDGKDYNYRAADTHRILQNLAGGVLTHYTLRPSVPSESPEPNTGDTPEENDMSFDVFLSHNSKDKPAVKRLGEALRKRNLTVWLDEWELRPGLTWQDALEDIITSCKSAAVCVGSNGIGPWEDPEMQALLRRFVAEKKSGNIVPIIPVLLPGAPSDVKLPLFLEAFTWVDFRDGLKKDGLDRLEWGITGIKPNP